MLLSTSTYCIGMLYKTQWQGEKKRTVVKVIKIIIAIGYTGIPQIFPWRANLLQSLAPTLIKLTYLWLSNDLEDSD